MRRAGMRFGLRAVLVIGLLVGVGRPAVAQEPKTLDHSYPEWQAFLAKYVKDGKVNYRALSNFSQPLQDVLAEISTVDKKTYNEWGEDQRIAFWLNAYNAAAIKVVVDHYPPERKGLNIRGWVYPARSIQQIPDVWNQPVIETFRGMLSLNEIEHTILRQDFEQPRIHFALVCSALGCPVLRGEPYVGEKLDAQLTDQTRQFLKDSKKFRYDTQKNLLHLSPIFDWFEEDFEFGGGAWAFVRAYWPDEKANQITEKSEVKWLPYDWALNEQVDEP